MSDVTVRLLDVAGSAELSPDEKVTAVAASIEWLGIAMALKLVHGERGAARRLGELGCPVGFDEEGDLVVRIARASAGGR